MTRRCLHLIILIEFVCPGSHVTESFQVGVYYWGLAPQKQPGSYMYQGGEMMMMMMMTMMARMMMMMMKSVSSRGKHWQKAYDAKEVMWISVKSISITVC